MDRSSDPPVDGSAPGPVARAIGGAREWLDWFGVARLVVAAAATVVVALGAWWLVRTPPPPTEAVLPAVGPATTPPPTDPATTSTSPEARTDVAPVVVHVVGAVVRPDVYELLPGARVADAIDVAGGPTPEADVDAVNLAAPVVDGSRLHVPRRGEPAQPIEVPIEVPIGSGPGAGPSPPVVDVNRATADELDALPGVGPATAAAIVAEREGGGPFATVDDLTRVPGIGPAKLAALRDLVTT